MRARAVDFEVSDPSAVPLRASALLAATPDEINVVETAPGRFHANLIRADAEVEISVSADRMQAVIGAYAPALGGGRPLDRQLLSAALKRVGVTLLDERAIDQVLQRAARGEDVTNSIVAQGDAPKDGEDGALEVVCDLSWPVFPGDVIAVIKPPLPPKDGHTVEGRALIPAHRSAQPFRVSVRTGCRMVDQGRIRAEAYGIVTVEGNSVSIEPLLSVSKDRMSVVGTLYPQDAQGNPLTVERLKSALAVMSVKAEPNAEAVQSTVASGMVNKKAVVARGTPPVAGADGRLELEIETGEIAGEVHADGTIDFRERNIVHSVVRGALLGHLYPPQKGTPGRDVFNTPLPAKDGSPANLTLGPNVQRNGTELRARSDGMVLFARNTLSVTDVCRIPGDLDYATGNIRMEQGSIVVDGSIRTGFAAKSSGNILVGNQIGGALVEAAGNIDVRRGIGMHGKGRISAGGTVRAHFIENARVYAEGDVIVGAEITNSEITTFGKVIASSGRGRIQGGVITAAEGVEANEIGSELEPTTMIVVGRESKVMMALEWERASLEETIREITHLVGERPGQSHGGSIGEQLQTRERAKKRLNEVMKKIAEERKRMSLNTTGLVRVRRTVHPGTTIVIGEGVIEIVSPIKNSQFLLEPKTSKIRVLPL